VGGLGATERRSKGVAGLGYCEDSKSPQDSQRLRGRRIWVEAAVVGAAWGRRDCYCRLEKVGMLREGWETRWN